MEIESPHNRIALTYGWGFHNQAVMYFSSVGMSEITRHLTNINSSALSESITKENFKNSNNKNFGWLYLISDTSTVATTGFWSFGYTKTLFLNVAFSSPSDPPLLALLTYILRSVTNKHYRPGTVIVL